MTVTGFTSVEPQPALSAPKPLCRLCDAPLQRVFCDLGAQPSANAYLRADQLNGMEPTWPLKAYVCDVCHLVQLEALHSSEQLFSDYAYFSSYSNEWLDHARAYAEKMVAWRGKENLRLVVEVASNDGYLLQYFQRQGVTVLGIDPAANVAAVARQRGVPTLVRLFGRDLAASLTGRGVKADLIVANNVLAHVPDIRDFAGGLATLLQPKGIITVEFPHLLRLMAETQFDTIYHEHFSYLSLGVVQRLLADEGLVIFDVEELPTHGGSLRVFAAHRNAGFEVSPRVDVLRENEVAAGLDDAGAYEAFAARVAKVRRDLMRTLIDIRDGGETVAAYGAPAKGNTLLNFCGIGPDLVDFTVDRNPNKRGRWLPGSRIPVHAPAHLREARPDYVLILPWNLKREIMRSCDFIREWGGKFIIPIPSVTVVP